MVVLVSKGRLEILEIKEQLVIRAARVRVEHKVLVEILEPPVELERKELQETVVIQEVRAIKGLKVPLV